MIRSYEEMMKYDSFEDRFKYLFLGDNKVGDMTFNGKRYLNQRLYQSPEWRHIRNQVIIRDNGFDLAHPNRPIGGKHLIHHINPITAEDLLYNNPKVFDIDNLVLVSFDTHNNIHFGINDESYTKDYIPRSEFDTCPWKNMR